MRSSTVSRPETTPTQDQPVVAGRSQLGKTPRLRLVLTMVDCVALTVAWLAAIALPDVLGSSAGRTVRDLAWSFLAILISLLFIAGQRLYLSRICSVRAVELQRLARAVVLTGVTLFVAEQLVDPFLASSRIAVGGAAAFVLVGAGRGMYRSWLAEQRRRGRHVRPVVLVGANEEAEKLAAIIDDHPEVGLRIDGMVGSREDAARVHAPWLGAIDDATAAVRRTGATGVIIVVSAIQPARLNELVRQLLVIGVHVRLSMGIRGIAHRRLRAAPLAHEPLFYLEAAGLARWQRLVKRCLDVAVATALGIASLPVLAIAAAAIKLDDGGPLLFPQRRIGRDNQPFTMYKLRTMVVDAERRLDGVRAQNQRADGPLFKLLSDPRMTRVGRMLRATSIDELPQLANVLRGSMSLVGPRPALPHEVEEFDDALRVRAQVLPGITGLWQVEARDNPSFGPYKRLDLFYVENWSVGLDFGILVATVGVVMGRAWRVLPRIMRQSRRRAPSTIVLD